MSRQRRVIVSALVLLVCVVSAGSRAGRAAAEALPASLSDREYWTIISQISEPNGFFRSENLVSNERTFQFVIPDLLKTARAGGVYLGVAPDQNFTYIAALQPRMAFICDIRRGNLLEHLMYKALFELSPDRATFVSKLFSRPRPKGLTADSTVADIFTAFEPVASSEALYHENLAAMRDVLLTRHHFPLSDEDLSQIETIYGAFFSDGPDLRYTAAPSFVVNGFSGGGYGRFGGPTPDFPSYEELVVATDSVGRHRSYLATEANYQFLKAFEAKNLLVPIIGDFAGPRALKGIGDYIRAHGETVTAFYVSNVEQYLMQDGVFTDFARNIATLPVDARSVFIRSVWSRYGYQGTLLGPDGRASALDPIRTFVRDVQEGKVRSYYDLNARSR